MSSAIVYASLYIFSTLLFIFSARTVAQLDDVPARNGFLVLTAIGGIWSAVTFIQTITSHPPLLKVSFIADGLFEAIVPLIWLVFVRKYTGYRNIINKKLLAFAGIHYVIFATTYLTTGYHAILVKNFHYVTDPYTTYIIEYTTIHLLHRGLSYLFIGVGMACLIHMSLTVRSIHRRKLLLLVISGIIPTILGVGRDLGILDLTVRHTAFGLAIFGPISVVALYRFQLVDVTPVGQAKLFNSLRDAIIITDQDNQIIRYNSGCFQFLPESVTSTESRQLEEVLPEELLSVDQILETTNLREQVTVIHDSGEITHVDIDVSPLTLNEDTVGKIITITDTTQIAEQQRELERQHERLDQFANSLSNDFRNALNVADIYLSIAKETRQDRHFNTVEESYADMESLIEDVLILARDGQTVTDPEPVQLATEATTIHQNANTDTNLILNIPNNYYINSNADRLTHILTNLFENAEQHGDATEIHIETIPGGFTVKDNGTGIPEDIQPKIFEHGFTTESSQSGFGLSIVKTVAEAHGWRVKLNSDSDWDGAEFIFHGVSTTQTETPDETP